MKTITRIAGAGIAAALLSLSPAVAKEPVKIGEEASIPFADTTGVRNFRADGDSALYIEDQSGRWYRAETLGTCTGLNFANAIGVVTKGTGTLDKFGQILVDGRTCQLKSLVRAEDPAKAKDKDAAKDGDKG